MVQESVYHALSWKVETFTFSYSTLNGGEIEEEEKHHRHHQIENEQLDDDNDGDDDGNGNGDDDGDDDSSDDGDVDCIRGAAHVFGNALDSARNPFPSSADQIPILILWPDSHSHSVPILWPW